MRYAAFLLIFLSGCTHCEINDKITQTLSHAIAVSLRCIKPDIVIKDVGEVVDGKNVCRANILSDEYKANFPESGEWSHDALLCHLMIGNVQQLLVGPTTKDRWGCASTYLERKELVEACRNLGE